MPARVVKFFRLAPEERLIFLRALYLMSSCRLALRVRGFQGTVMAPPPCGKKHGDEPFPSVATLLKLCTAAGRLIPWSTCLSQALATRTLLAEHGLAANLHIGVAREGERQLEAHAWLTLEGRVVLGTIPDLERYRELPLPEKEAMT